MPTLATGARNAMANAIADLVDVGAGANGTLEILEGSTVLAVLNLAAPAFGDAASGVVTANAITDDSAADATGTADTCKIKDKDGNLVITGSVSNSAGSGDLKLLSTAITLGEPVAVDSLSFTMPAS